MERTRIEDFSLNKSHRHSPRLSSFDLLCIQSAFTSSDKEVDVESDIRSLPCYVCQETSWQIHRGRAGRMSSCWICSKNVKLLDMLALRRSLGSAVDKKNVRNVKLLISSRCAVTEAVLSMNRMVFTLVVARTRTQTRPATLV